MQVCITHYVWIIASTSGNNNIIQKKKINKLLIVQRVGIYFDYLQ